MINQKWEAKKKFCLVLQVDTFLKLISECTKYPARAKNVDTKTEIGVLIRKGHFWKPSTE